MTEYEKIQTELEHYKKIFATSDIATRGYRVIVNQLEQQIEYLEEFKFKENIVKAVKEDPVYERAQKIFREMPEVILSLKELKDKLGIEYVEKEIRAVATTPQSIAKMIS